VHPVRVHGGYVLACTNGYVGAGGSARCVAGQGGVGGFEDGVVGYPFSLWHPRDSVLHGFIAVGVVAGIVVSWVETVVI